MIDETIDLLTFVSNHPEKSKLHSKLETQDKTTQRTQDVNLSPINYQLISPNLPNPHLHQKLNYKNSPHSIHSSLAKTSQRDPNALLPCYLVTLPTRYLVASVPRNLVALVPCYHITPVPCHLRAYFFLSF